MQKLHFAQNAKIVIFAVPALLFLLLTVLALLPESSDLEIREAFRVSSSVLGENDVQILADGVLRNKTDADVTVEVLSVVTDKGTVLQKTGFTVPARSEVPVSIRQTADGTAGKVRTVSVTVSGKTEKALRNPAVTNTFAYALMPALLCLLFVFLTVHACIVRFYLGQEDLLTVGDGETPTDPPSEQP